MNKGLFLSNAKKRTTICLKIEKYQLKYTDKFDSNGLEFYLKIFVFPNMGLNFYEHLF